MNMELNQELYSKCVAASEILFTDKLVDIAANKCLSEDTINIIKENDAKRLYNFYLKSFWIGDIDIEKRICDYNNTDNDPLNIHFLLEFFDTIR